MPYMIPNPCFQINLQLNQNFFGKLDKMDSVRDLNLKVRKGTLQKTLTAKAKMF